MKSFVLLACLMLCGCIPAIMIAYVFGYYRGVKFATKLGLKAMDELNKANLECAKRNMDELAETLSKRVLYMPQISKTRTLVKPGPFMPSGLYHIHLKTEEVETVITALARMAVSFPQCAGLCDKAAEAIGSLNMMESYTMQKRIFTDLKGANKITWTCHVCGKERPDQLISVFKRDISHTFGLPTGTVQENVRYCNDSQSCFDRAQSYRHLKQ